jgi:hypothetical protein
VPLGQPAIAALLRIMEADPGLRLADLGTSGMRVSRFALHAGPRRIEIEPTLAEQLELD